MKRILLACAILFSTACQSASDGLQLPRLLGAPQSAEDALEDYYRSLPDDFYPVAPAGVSLPSDTQSISRILVGSCFDEEKTEESAIAQSIAREGADLFLMVGDNVYGDKNGRAYINNQAELEELRESFAELGARSDFQAIRSTIPMMVAWDDHDYGANDAGKEFPFRRLAERVHERFWGLDNQDVGAWDGTYYSRSFGPAGQRTQVIMLDTRFFRTALTPTDAWGEAGKERYIPSDDPQQDMLGTDQWTWLENELQKPADLRIIASSIQVLPEDGHGWESWSRLPQERARLLQLVSESGANGVVFVSGDRHTAFLYRKDGALPYPAYELTASSMNLSFFDESAEIDSAQINAGFAKENYGALEVDWARGRVTLKIKDGAGQTVNQTTAAFR